MAYSHKMLCGPRQRVYVDPIVPIDQQKQELYIGELVKIALESNNKIENLRISEDDSHKGPDLKCTINGDPIGIQVTRFTVSGSRRAKIVAQQLAIKILKNIHPRLNIPERTIVTFDSIYDRSNDILKIKKRKLVKLCDFIVSEVSNHKNLYKGRTELEYFLYPFTIEVPDFLKPEVTSILIQYPPDDQVIYVPGKDNIYVNFNFDTRTVSDSTIEEESTQIFNKKNNGSSEILAIWADKSEIFNQDEKVYNELKKVFSSTTFMNVFLITLRNMNDKYSEKFEFRIIK